ncbi:MAG: PadR family transcriptional regulator [Actinomycetes bacterium]
MDAPGRHSSLTQLRRGALEYCVLALVNDQERYAVDLVDDLGRIQALVTSEGTLYPLLSRLRREGKVATTWRESELGPPRRYYRITNSGRVALQGFAQEWTSFRDAVDALIIEGN